MMTLMATSGFVQSNATPCYAQSVLGPPEHKGVAEDDSIPNLLNPHIFLIYLSFRPPTISIWVPMCYMCISNIYWILMHMDNYEYTSPITSGLVLLGHAALLVGQFSFSQLRSQLFPWEPAIENLKSAIW